MFQEQCRSCNKYLLVYLFGVLRRFQHCTGHITTGSWKGRGNQYIQFVRVLYCKLRTNKHLLVYICYCYPVIVIVTVILFMKKLGVSK